jgi:glycosyltransferase involved in cell wall biosynthesis
MLTFSVIIPLYNKEKHIHDTLNSIFKQIFTDFEIIIINDASTDNSLQKVLELKNNRIFIYENNNKGVSQARNLGMQKAKGKYFAFLDADDIWHKNHLKNLYHLIKEYPNCGLYCTNYIFDYGNNFIVKTRFSSLPIKKDWKGIVHNYFLASLKDRIAWTSAVAIPREIFDQLGGFDEKITLGAGEDIDYWTRIAIKKEVAFTKQVSVSYKTSSDNRVSNINPLKRKFMKIDKFHEEEKINLSLKAFNDMYRLELAIKHKIAGDLKTSKYYIEKISWKNIKWTKKILIKLPQKTLKKLWDLKQWLKTNGIDFYI